MTDYERVLKFFEENYIVNFIKRYDEVAEELGNGKIDKNIKKIKILVLQNEKEHNEERQKEIEQIRNYLISMRQKAMELKYTIQACGYIHDIVEPDYKRIDDLHSKLRNTLFSSQ